MWKKSKRILSCILALMLLLSMAKSEQLFVQADTESTEKVQTKDVKNRSQRQEENSDEKGQEESTDKKEEASTKATQKTEETIKEDKKNLEATTQKEKDASKNDEAKEETEEKTEEYKREEENTERKTDENKAAEEVSAEENSDAKENSTEKASTEQLTETEEIQEQKIEEQETTEETVETTQFENKEKEYIPESQPEGVVIKAYAMEKVFPEGTVLKVTNLGEKELGSAENVLKKGNVKYGGLFGYDISFYDKTGKEIEPEKGSVRVVMQMSDNVLPEEVLLLSQAICNLPVSVFGFPLKYML